MKRLLLPAAFLAIALVPLFIARANQSKTANPPAPVNPQALYGVIEVGGSGIKPMLFEKKDAQVHFLKSYEVTNADAFSWTAASSGQVADSLQQTVKKMEDEAKVPADHFYVVGSSGVPAEVRSALSDSIMQELHFKISYLSMEQESQLVFRNIVPKDELDEVVVLDIGSGNAKGSYAVPRDDGPQFVSFGIPYGTKTFAERVDAERHDGSFAVTADSLRQQLLEPAIRDNVEIAPGMQHRPRIYLVGGIAWVMSLVTHPYEMKQTLIHYTPEEIDAFLKKAIASPRDALQPDLAAAPHQPKEHVTEARKKAADAIAKVGDIFTDDQIMAGAILLKTFLEEMGYQNRDVYFYSQALYAWPQQYILETNQDAGN